MSTHKRIDRVCCIAIALAIVLSCAMAFGKTVGISAAPRTLGYETRLFDAARVHTIDIEMDDWDSFLASCENEEYAACTLVIDNESKKNVAIRAKGNTSLRNVSQLGSQRYSFKVEFDHYESGKSYYGLDKLSLNNLIQDNTMMKDYLTYSLMGDFGVAAPLCSYAYVTVNGEDWGLYLAVEGVEDAFLSRNFGGEGDLYKPDSMDMGGGRGNGRDFEMEFDSEGEGFRPDGERTPDASENADEMPPQWNGANEAQGFDPPQMPDGQRGMGRGGMGGGMGRGGMGGGMQQPNGEMPSMPDGEMPSMPDGEMPSMPDGEMPSMPDGEMPSMPNGEMPAMPDGEGGNLPFQPMDGEMPDMENGEPPTMPQGGMGGMGGPGGGNGSADVKLQYIDDDPDSYANIFENAKTDLTAADKKRLIASLKALSAQENIAEVVNVEEVLRYFVVHDFVCNGDSYTGGMIHNYYLYESDGKLSMIPWDYNLAFGGFQSFSATDSVNDPIDSPVSGGSIEDRPMVAWIFDDGEYQAQYHALYAQLLREADFAAKIAETKALIAPYVERDPSKFCTLEEFEAGVQALTTFCTLRTESIQGQLAGTIPSTSAGQSEDSSALVDASGLTISDMGTMQDGMGGHGGGMDTPEGERPSDAAASSGATAPQRFGQRPDGNEPFGGGFPGEPGRSSTQTWLLLGLSVLALALGLLATKLFRRK